MSTSPTWARARGTSIARGAVALVGLVAASAIAAWLWSIGDPVLSPTFAEAFVTSLLTFGLVPFVWLALAGARLDHHLSRFGAVAVLVVHVLGTLATSTLVLGGITIYAMVSALDINETFAFPAFILIPLAVFSGFLVTHLVPKSFPKGKKLSLVEIAPAMRAIGGGWEDIRG